jgi:DNA-binding PadR family transcriptional regulator
MKIEPLTECYFYILLCLYHKPNHGYGIMQEIDLMTNKRVKIGSGTMYGAISNMISKGWIAETTSLDPADYRKRLYQITALGKQVLEQERARLKELVSCAAVIMGEGDDLK